MDTKKSLSLEQEQLGLCRQWFNAVQDLNPAYLTDEDYILAEQLYKALGQRFSNADTARVRLAKRKQKLPPQRRQLGESK